MKELQQKIKAFADEHGLGGSAEVRVLDLVSEVGEVSKEILKMTDYGSKASEMREETKGELGDCLFSLVMLANSVNVDLGEAVDEVLAKYEKRLSKGGAGSENE